MERTTQSPLLFRIADRLDQAVIVALFVWLCLRLFPEDLKPEHLYSIMLLASEGVVLFFVLIRRSTDKITLNLQDWIVALGGTTVVMFIENKSATFLPKTGFILIFIGFLIHFGAKLSLRRSFGLVPADRGIISTGFYALVRHPIYLGYMISHVGFLLSVPSMWNFAMYAIAWPLLVFRMVLEERLLLQNTEYQTYASKVRHRIIPGLF